ncbi:MAG: prolyl oligopeptidase family serine peptidase, partial [bacterium]
MKRVIYGVLAAFIVLTEISAAGAGDPKKPHAGEKAGGIKPWTVDDVVMNEAIGEYVVSPDGQSVVWTKVTSDKDKNARVTNLMLSSMTEQEEIELTRGNDRNTSPRWSPDGRRNAFLSDRPLPNGESGDGGDDGAGEQIWLMNPFGGEPWPLTTGKRGPTQFVWLDDVTVVFSAQEGAALYESELKEKKDETIVVEDERHEPPVRLFKVDVETKEVTRLTNNGDWIEHFAISPDGRYAVAVHNKSLRYEYDNLIKPVTVLHDLEAGGQKQLFQDLNPQEFRWAPDGKGFYVVTAFTHDPRYINAYVNLLYYYDLASGATTHVNVDWDNGLSVLFEGINGMQITDDGFVALMANGVHPNLARFTRAADGQTWTREWIAGDHVGNIFGLALSKHDTSLVYSYSTASTPEQLYRAELKGATLEDEKALTDLNANLKEREIAKTEIVRWKGAREDEVEGILYFPHHYESGNKYALVVSIHGGPAYLDFDTWSEGWGSPNNLLAQRGAFVLEVNYHGSSDYGLDWAEAIGGGKYYDLEIPDIESGVDALIAWGLVDPNKLGVMGWSNGSILTIELTTRTTRYKAASAGAGDVEWSSDWGNCAFGAAFDNYYFGATPLENPQKYIEKSPFWRMDKVRTPTIIFFGSEDTNVPTEQGWMHYRALQQLGNTDVRFILFPGEGHGPAKISHRRRKLEEEMA